MPSRPFLTLAAAGAPLADSAAAVMDSVATNNDSVNVIPADSVADTTVNN